MTRTKPSSAETSSLPEQETVSFGFEDVSPTEKVSRVKGVFRSVAGRYDLMNDLMSAGVHRIWKANTIARLNPQPGETYLDVAGGTGDLSLAFLKDAGQKAARRNQHQKTSRARGRAVARRSRQEDTAPADKGKVAAKTAPWHGKGQTGQPPRQGKGQTGRQGQEQKQTPAENKGLGEHGLAGTPLEMVGQRRRQHKSMRRAAWRTARRHSTAARRGSSI